MSLTSLRCDLKDIIWDNEFILEGEEHKFGKENASGLKFSLYAHQVFYKVPEDYPGCGDYFIGVSLITDPIYQFKKFTGGYHPDKLVCVATSSLKTTKKDTGVIAHIKPISCTKSGLILWGPDVQKVFKLPNGLSDKIDFVICDIKGYSLETDSSNFQPDECLLQVSVIKTKRRMNFFIE